MKPARQRRLGGAAIALAALWIYFPALGGGWIWDDLPEIPFNRTLPDPAGWAKAWIAPTGADYLPFKTLVQWVGWRLWGGAPLGYHLLNLALHVSAALVLWRCLRQLGARWAWFGGLLFALHPLAVESVAWIAELKNTLSLPLMLGSFLGFLAFERTGRRWSYALSLGAFVLALLAKASVVMLPAILLLLAWWQRGRIGVRDLRRTAPYFAAALAVGLVTVWFQEHRALTPGALTVGGWASRVAAAGSALGFYAWKCVLPLGLIPVYPRWVVDPPQPWQFLPWLGLAAGSFWLLRRRDAPSRAAAFGLGVFVLNLLPVLGFLPMSYQRLAWAADHLAYVALAAATGLAAAGLGRIDASLDARGRTILRAAAALAAAALGYESHGYAAIFRDDAVLWRYTLARNPSCWLAENDLGLDEEKAGHYAEAGAHFQRALALRPDFPEAEVNLGETLVLSGRPAEAIAWYRRAIAENPRQEQAHAHLALALVGVGRSEEARAEFEAALQLKPEDAAAAYGFGNLLGNAGDLPGAIARYRQALASKPDYPEARAGLGFALVLTHRLDEGMGELREALRLKPGWADAEEYLGYALGRAGRWNEAISCYERARATDAGNPDLHYNLAEALRAIGREAEAAAEQMEADRLAQNRRQR